MIIVICKLIPIETLVFVFALIMTPRLRLQTHLYTIYIPPFLSFTSHTELGHMLPLSLSPYTSFSPSPCLSLSLSHARSSSSLMSCVNVGVRVHVWPRAKLLHAAPWTLVGVKQPPPSSSSSPSAYMWGPERDLSPKITHTHIHMHTYMHTHTACEEEAVRPKGWESHWMGQIKLGWGGWRMGRGGAKEVL